jgi:cold shock CspA family protein
MSQTLFTIARRTFGARVAPVSPILYPRVDPQVLNPPKRVLKTTSPTPKHGVKKYLVTALHGGGETIRYHKNPPKLAAFRIKAEKNGWTDKRFTGRVLQAQQSYGYILCNETKETIFYHISNVDLQGYIRFLPGQKVTFAVGTHGKNTVAATVRPLVQQFKQATEIDLATGAMIKPNIAQV